MAQQHKQAHWSPAWVALVGALGSVAAVLAVQAQVVPVKWWGFPLFALAGAAVTVMVSFSAGGWPRGALLVVTRGLAYRALIWLSVGAWATWASLAGWTPQVWAALVVGAAVLAGLSHVCRLPEKERAAWAVEHAGEVADRRPANVRWWEGLLRQRANAPVVVTAVVPWDNPADGERVYVDLPADGKVTEQTFVDLRRALAVARKLPPGCTVRVDDGEHQGQVVLDVMLRDCLTDSIEVDDDYSPASIYDEFQVMTSPRGESLEVCLRSHSMVIGGAPDSGKTTLLHRIILFLARCTDTLIWVVDANGGGVATPWVRPWAMSKAGRPIIDWVAPDEDEAAVLVATATAIAKDRKVSPEAVRRKHHEDTTVLPVDERLPAIVVLNDEGGEMRQAASLLGQLADEGISRLAQIGRAEAVRAIKSVLRGTSDLLDKGMRVCAPLRICLRMEEEGEYVHVLGEEPGRTKLLHKGTGFARRPGDPRPILARTVNVLLSQIERAAIACADLRPDLDDRGRRVAAKLRARDVLGGRDPANFPDVMALPVMRDVEAGRAYEGRWDRFAGRLAAMRGEELPELGEADEPEEATAPPAPAPARATGGSALAALSAAVKPAVPAGGSPPEPDQAAVRVDLTDKATVDRVAQELLSGVDWQRGPQHAEPVAEQRAPKVTTREHILAILAEAYPDSLTSAQIGIRLERREAGVHRTYRQDVLKSMREAGEVVQAQSGAYLVVKAP